MKSLAGKLTLSIGIASALLATYLFYETYRMTNRRLNDVVVQQADMALQFDLSIRSYVGKVVRPMMYDLLGEDEFVPETMSTSYVARSIFEDVHKQFPDTIIKFSSDNPRNPVNQAGPEEMEVIRYFNDNPHIERWSGQIEINGRAYLANFSARRMKPSCLKCHGDPADAPRSLIERYGDKAGFHRPLGEVIGTDTVAIPLSTMTRSLWTESVDTFILIGLSVAFFFFIITAIIRLHVTAPLSKISRHMSEAASGDSYRDIAKLRVASRDEIGDVARSFNVLFSKLHEFYNSLEDKVAERTADLKQANDNLLREIQARKETQQSLELTQFLINHFSDPIFIIQQDARIQFANIAASRRLGYSLETLVTMTLFDIDANIPADAWPSFWRELRKQETVLMESLYETKTGELFPVDIRANYYKLGRQEYNFTVVRDISEHKQARIEKNLLEKRLRRALKMEAIGTLAGGVAHDLNNVLSGLVSYPEVILMTLPEDSDFRAPMETIRQSGQKAAEIVQDLLTLARRGVAQFKPVNMNAVITDYLVSPELKEAIKNNPDNRIRTDLAPDLLNIMGSEVHLSKTIMNLVINALEAMPDGGACTLSTQNRYVDQTLQDYDDVQEGDYVLVEISDTGHGMSEEDKERIFEPFYTKKTMGKSGTGLGMTVVWSTIKDHDGFIGINSEPDSGTVFKLFFPATRKQLDEDETRFVLDHHKGDGETILVVDDVLEQRQIAAAILEKLGYEAVTVAGGEEAVAYLKKHTVALVVLDMIMDPGIDGLETYRRIIDIHPGQNAIIVSGFSESARVKALQRLGAGQYVRKPYTVEKLAETVKTALSS
jgi:two-component system cell cycle sensor histidine kinase/response regulator CckA